MAVKNSITTLMTAGLTLFSLNSQAIVTQPKNLVFTEYTYSEDHSNLLLGVGTGQHIGEVGGVFYSYETGTLKQGQNFENQTIGIKGLMLKGEHNTGAELFIGVSRTEVKNAFSRAGFDIGLYFYSTPIDGLYMGAGGEIGYLQFEETQGYKGHYGYGAKIGYQLNKHLAVDVGYKLKSGQFLDKQYELNSGIETTIRISF